MKKLIAFNLKIFDALRLCALAGTFFLSLQAQTLAPGAPGKDAQWATAGKQAVGTSANLESKVWFTLAQGVMTEVYYPDVTVANVHILQFVVVNPKTKKVETEQDDATHEIDPMYGLDLGFDQINKAKSGEWEIIKNYVSDPDRNSVKISFFVRTKNKDLKFYLYYDPSLANSGMNDTAWSEKRDLLACDGEKCSALITGNGFYKTTSGFLGTSDGLTQLKQNGTFNVYKKAENGNVVQFAQLESTRYSPKSLNWELQQTFVLGFGKSSNEALQTAKITLRNSVDVWAKYKKGWHNYLKTIPKVELKYQAQFNMAAMQLKALEDKTVRGANIASLTVPWGGGANANENNIGGYHLIWARDLYQVFTAYMALGDKAAAERALDFLFNVQQKPDGSFPQNSFLDGKPFWGSLQMDEVAYPLIMAWQLKRFDEKTWKNHVKRAADFIVKNGPATPQERWEEEAGYSPSTIAAEIAGLVCAAEIAKANNDLESANLYLKTADEWQANIEKWTVTTNGRYSKSPYYVRITQNGKPDAGEKIELNNGAGFFDEREIVDAGFLELVRLGIKSPDDPIIQNSVKVIDEVIRVRTPNGDGFYRYNHDGYGEMDDGRRWNWDGKYTGKGRLWALLSGERGQYELALESKVQSPKSKVQSPKSKVQSPKSRLDSMLGFANEGLMIPEQIWDSPNVPKNADKQFVPELKFGEGTGSATPLAWSMAQFIRLAVNLQAGKNTDTPQVVYDRYVLGKRLEISQQKTEEKTVVGDCPNLDSYRFDKKDVLMALPLKDQIYPHPFGQIGAKESAMRFAYFGNEKEIEIAGDFTGWKPCGLKFIKIGALPNVNYLILKFPNSARVEYKLIVDGKWITDSANPNKIDNGVGGENSYFEMPDYKPTEWLKWKQAPERPLEKITINSKTFGEREIQVYVPSSGEPLSVLYLQDGSDYINRANAKDIQLNLVIAKKIKPFIMVFLDPKDRMKEYWASETYAKFVAEEVVPAIDAKYKTIKSRDGRAIIGASLGGITSVWVGLKYPQVFSKIGGQSTSFWIDDERVVKELAKLDLKNAKYTFYFDDGTLEGTEDTRRVVDILRAKGFSVTYTEGETGHNWTSWRDRLANAFVAFMN